MTTVRRTDAGLSLVEVLVSLAIFAVIGIAGLAVLNTVARTAERTEGRLDRLAEIDRAFLVIRRDLAQIRIADVLLEGGVLAFERATGDADVQVRFDLEDSTLLRRIMMPSGASVDQEMLPHIEAVAWRLMDADRRWHTAWPPGGDVPSGMPVAAELALEVPRDGVSESRQITRLMVLPAGQGS